VLEPAGWVRMRLGVEWLDGREAYRLGGTLDLDEIIQLEEIRQAISGRRDGGNAQSMPVSSAAMS
jgi:hypothetical protein